MQAEFIAYLDKLYASTDQYKILEEKNFEWRSYQCLLLSIYSSASPYIKG